MAYEPQIWNSGNPELSLEENKENNAVLVAEKMNNIEQGIKTAHDEIANVELQKGDKRTKGYVIPEIKLHHNAISDTKEMYFDVYRESWSEWHGEGSLPIHIAYRNFNEITQKHEINYITISASSFVDNRFSFLSKENEPFDTLYDSYIEGGGLNGNPSFFQQQEYETGITMKLIYNTFVVFGGEDEMKVMQPVQLVFTLEMPAEDAPAEDAPAE